MTRTYHLPPAQDPKRSRLNMRRNIVRLDPDSVLRDPLLVMTPRPTCRTSRRLRLLAEFRLASGASGLVWRQQRHHAALHHGFPYLGAGHAADGGQSTGAWSHHPEPGGRPQLGAGCRQFPAPHQCQAGFGDLCHEDEDVYSPHPPPQYPPGPRNRPQHQHTAPNLQPGGEGSNKRLLRPCS